MENKISKLGVQPRNRKYKSGLSKLNTILTNKGEVADNTDFTFLSDIEAFWIRTVRKATPDLEKRMRLSERAAGDLDQDLDEVSPEELLQMSLDSELGLSESLFDGGLTEEDSVHDFLEFNISFDPPTTPELKTQISRPRTPNSVADRPGNLGVILVVLTLFFFV